MEKVNVNNYNRSLLLFFMTLYQVYYLYYPTSPRLKWIYFSIIFRFNLVEVYNTNPEQNITMITFMILHLLILDDMFLM